MNWQEDFLHALQDTKCEKDVLEKNILFINELEFDYCAYGLRSQLPLTKPKTITINNYPSSWKTQYESNNYLEIDPTVKHALQSVLPIIWTDKLFSSASDLWEEAHKFGLHYGLAFPIHDLKGFKGMLTLSRSHEFISEKEFDAKILKISWLTQITHLSMSKHLTPKLIPGIDTNLSPRETEILRWTADGKTSGEISCILKISERTVNFHINNTIHKLNACNKTSATIKAVMLGLL